MVGWENSGLVKGRARTVEAAVHEFADYLMGKDPAYQRPVAGNVPGRFLSRRPDYDETPSPVIATLCGISRQGVECAGLAWAALVRDKSRPI